MECQKVKLSVIKGKLFISARVMNLNQKKTNSHWQSLLADELLILWGC